MIQKIPKKYKKLLKAKRYKMKIDLTKEVLNSHLSSFRNEFKKHLSTFITGAFAFVAALVWRDAISKSIESLKVRIPYLGGWIFDYTVAIIITVVAVIAIVIISKLLKVEEK